MNDILLEVRGLKKYFSVGHGQVLKAVDGIDFAIKRGETLGLVGESGCGKSTVGRTIIRLYKPTEGSVSLLGKDIYKANRSESMHLCRQMQMIFQDPYASLNPRMTVSDIIGEALDIHGLAKGRARQQKIEEYLEMVGLYPENASRFPHEFSGGQRQRIGIARALAVEPLFIVCDEPISALDVSIQAQVVNLLEKLQKELKLTYLFIAHDLSMVRHISDRVAVMYLGKIMEIAGSQELYKNACHPYTKALLSAIPIPDPQIESQRKRIILCGDVPSPINPPAGCRFSGRCPQAEKLCFEREPEMRQTGSDHWVSCYLA